MKLSPPHQSLALSRRGSPPPLPPQNSPIRAGTAETADSPAQGG